MNEKRPLRIVWLADAGHVDVQRWYKALEKAGAELHLLSFRSGGSKLPQALPIPIPPRLQKLQYLAALPYVRRQIQEIKPDMVIAYYITGYGTLAALAGYRPLVLSTAGSDILVSPQNPIMRRVIQFNLSRADMTTALAPHMADAIHQLGVAEDRIAIIPLGIPVEEFAKTRCAPPVLGEPIRIVCTRSLQARYNNDRLIRVIHTLRQRGFEAHLTIAGDGPERANLMALAQQLDVQQYVSFLGFVPNDQLPTILAQHNLYISLIPSDGVSSSLIEAMSVGLMPIVPDNAANRYWIEHRKTGLLLDNIEPATVAEAAVEAITNLALRQRAWHDNLITARNRGDLYRNSESYVDCLRQLIHREPIRHASATT